MATATISVIDTEHADMVHDAQFDFYGKRVATCSSDRLIKVYDIAADGTGAPALVANIVAHEGPVWQVSWSHPQFGSLLASCGYDRHVCIHKETSPGVWTLIKTFDEHASSVNSVSWAPAEVGLHLASASSDGSVAVLTHQDDNSWSQAILRGVSSPGVNAVSWAPAHHIGGTYTDAISNTTLYVKRLATAGSDNKIKVYRQHPASPGDLPDGWALESTLSGHKDWVRDVAWCPSSGLGANVLASASDDGTVMIWKQTVADGPWSSETLPQFPAAVWRVSWNPLGSILAVSCGDNSVTLWKENVTGAWQQVSTVPDPATPAAPRPGY